MTDTDETAAGDNEYVAALRREAEGYIARGNAEGLAAVNAELVAQGEKPIKTAVDAKDNAQARAVAKKKG